MQLITCAQPRDVIALAWFRIGFRPRESLVLVGLHGPRHRAGMVLRIDLPPVAARRPTLRRLADLLHRGGDDEAIAMVVSDAGGGPRPGPDGRPVLPHRGLVRELRQVLPRQGISVMDVLAVGPDAYRSYLCNDTGCCPATGTSLDEVMSSEVAASMVLAGQCVADEERAIIADVEPEPSASAVLGGEPDRQGAAEQVPGSLSPWGSPGGREPGLACWRTLLADGADTPDDIPGLLVALDELPFRDALLLTLIPGADDIAERTLRLATTEDDEDPFLRKPNPDLAARGEHLLAAVARAAPPGQRAQPLAMLAWLAWWCGSGARARLLAERAVDDRPGHRLAILVATMLSAGVPPPWVGSLAS